MHELSIAMSLVDAACEEARRLGGVRVTALHVRIGPLSGVVIEPLTFSFGLAASDTDVAGAVLVVEETPLVAHCDPCGVDQIIPSPQHLRCPECGMPTAEVVSGRELELVALEIDDSCVADDEPNEGEPPANYRSVTESPDVAAHR